MPFVKDALAQTVPASINLAKPSCTSQPAIAQVGGASGGITGVQMVFVCVADLDGNGKQEVIVGSNNSAGGSQVHILDGTGVERGTGTKLAYLP